MKEKGAAENDLKKLQKDFEQMKASEANLRVENQQLSKVNSVLCSYTLFVSYLNKCNTYRVPLIMMQALNKSLRENIFQCLEDKGKWEKAYQPQVNIAYCDGYRDAWTHKYDPSTLTPDKMDRQYNLEVGNHNVDYYMVQIGEAVAILFPEDLVQEYEATQGRLLDTVVAGNSNDALTAAEASAEATVSGDLTTHTPLSYSSERITSEPANNPKEDVSPSLGNIY